MGEGEKTWKGQAHYTWWERISRNLWKRTVCRPRLGQSKIKVVNDEGQVPRRELVNENNIIFN